MREAKAEPGIEAGRIETLELTVAHQQVTIDELSDALAEQWRALERVRAQMDRLLDRVDALEPRGAQAVPTDRPPHW